MSQTPERRRKRCSVCGEIGHNKLSCPIILNSMPRKNTVTCSQCGQPGHNSRSCPVKPRSTTVTCSLCSRDGHNCRTCPLRSSKYIQQPSSNEAFPSPRSHTQQPPSSNIPDTTAPMEASDINSGAPDSELASHCAPAANPSKPLPTAFPSISPGSAPPPQADSSASLFGSGLNMSPVDSDPYHLGPIKSDYVFPMPNSVDEAVQLAWTASYRAWLDKEPLQWIEWLLPSTNASDATMPASTQYQFNSAIKLTEAMLRCLKRNSGMQGPMKAHLYDGADPVGKWEGERIATVVFPTAETVKMLQDVVSSGSPTRLVLIVNPQWMLEGQVISDFGIGADGERRSKFAESFQPVFFFRRMTVFGDRITLMRVYPGGWQVFWTSQEKETTLLSVEYRKPSYRRLVDLLKPFQDSRASMSWLQRMRDPGPPPQPMQSWPGMKLDPNTLQSASAGLPEDKSLGLPGAAATAKHIASDTTAFNNGSDLEMNAAPSPNWAGGGPTGNPQWGALALRSGDMSYSQHLSASDPRSSMDMPGGLIGRAGSGATDCLEEALAELTGESSESGQQEEQTASVLGGGGGLNTAYDMAVLSQIELQGSLGVDLGAVRADSASGPSGETNLQKVARLRSHLMRVNSQMQQLEQERAVIMNELSLVSAQDTEDQLQRMDSIDNLLKDADIPTTFAGSEQVPPMNGGLPVRLPTGSQTVDNAPLWQSDGADDAKDLKNNMMDLIKGMMGGK